MQKLNLNPNWNRGPAANTEHDQAHGEIARRLANVKTINIDAPNITAEIQSAIDAAAADLGGTIVLPPGLFIITQTLTMPTGVPVLIKGSGNFETSKGTRLRWMGGINDSVVEINSWGRIADLFMYNGNGTSGVVGIDGYGSSGGRSTYTTSIMNVHVKSFDIGFHLAYTWYNNFVECTASYCTTAGYKIGLEFNNSAFTSCHANKCGKGLVVYAGSRGVGFYACSFENSKICGIDLTNGRTGAFCYAWGFHDTYFEGNAQTAILAGYGVELDNVFINHDWLMTEGNPHGWIVDEAGANPNPGSIEIFSSNPIKINNVFFSSEIPVSNGFIYSGSLLAGAGNRGVTIGPTYPWLYLADLITRTPELVTKGILSKRSNFEIEITQLLDAAAGQSGFFIPPLFCTHENQILAAVLLLVETQIVVGAGFTVKAGTSGPNYENIINQTFSENISGVTVLTMPAPPIIYTEVHSHKYSGSAVTSGKYRLAFVFAG